METICRIVEQHELQEREYTNRQGIAEKFASLGFVLQVGCCTFYCEAVQDMARRMGTLPRDRYYVAELRAQARSWEDQNHQSRWENRLTLTNISEL